MTAVDGQVTADVGKELVSFHLEAPATAETALADTVETMFDLSGLSEADLAESKAVGVQCSRMDWPRIDDWRMRRSSDGYSRVTPTPCPSRGASPGSRAWMREMCSVSRPHATYAPPSASRSVERSKPRSSKRRCLRLQQGCTST